MKITNEALLERFDKFVKAIDGSDKIALLHDADTDGICSGTITATAIKRILNKDIDYKFHPFAGMRFFTKEQALELKEKGITKLISCDIALEGNPEFVKATSEFADILVIDHHVITQEITQDNVLLIKPQLFADMENPSRYATSKMVYDLFSRLTDLEDREWLAAAGSIADIATEPWQEWLASVFEKLNIEQKDDLFKTELGKVAMIINDTMSYDPEKVNEAFETVLNSKNVEELSNSKLIQYHEVVEEEVQKLTGRVEEDAEWHKDLKLIFYHVEPKYHIKSTISTILGQKFKDWTFILSSPEGKTMTISARRGDSKIAVNQLLRIALEGLPAAGGGGHIPAAGGRCRIEDFPKFKQKVLELLRSGFTGLEPES